MSLLEIRNLSKKYNGRYLFKDVNLNIEQGEVVVITGDSGCGKTTLLRCINMLEAPASGQVFIDGDEITAKGADVDRIRRKMGLVFQEYNLFSHLTALENVIKAPKVLNMISKTESVQYGLSYLRMVGMQDYANFRIDHLSGGQKQRVAIARCLAMKPEIIFFDEPTSTLDPLMADEVVAVIKNLTRKGLTCIIVTHDIDLIREVASRVIFIADEGIYEDVSKDEFITKPKGEKTVAFVRHLKTFNFDAKLPSIDIFSMFAQLHSYCYSYGIPERKAYRLEVTIEELFAAIDKLDKKGELSLAVAYEKATERCSLVIKENVMDVPVLESEYVDEISLALIKNSASEISATKKDGYNILSIIIKD